MEKITKEAYKQKKYLIDIISKKHEIFIPTSTIRITRVLIQ